ncbi:hypothetical protein EJV47_07990 [Hymenobacter gummosus]|uniref:Uncharacterized protein n=1 Tax=Hymenobacter gummosus TaxID=1776032 RepID=A0A3S0JC63_9BACT|nr:hypothetical protein [Hymenobacter gummosus]RTQ51724.1 hypothetical protein EJV47_07990 [Hymenobacter gummosus]
MHRTTATILGINFGLILLLGVVALATTHDPVAAAFTLLWFAVPLWLLNGLAWIVTLFKLPESRPYFQGFLLACLVLPIIGLGACGLAFVSG